MNHDIEQHLATVWEALETYQDRCLVKHDPELGNEIWDDLCLAMAVIREDLGLPDKTAPAIPKPAEPLESIADIKAAVDAGADVRCNGGSYKVIKDSIGQYLIKFLPERDNYVGLHGRAGTKYAETLNGGDFYIRS